MSAQPIAETQAVLPSAAEDGSPVFCLLAKRTYDIRADRLERAERTYPMILVDRYWDDGDAETSTVREETDLQPYKAATDVVVVGHARAPGGRPAAQVDVVVSVNGHGKAVRVTGDRRCVWRDGLAPEFTEPLPFTALPLRYDHAYGGEDACSDPAQPFYYPRNQRGTGVAVRNLREVVDGMRLPNVEDPRDPLTPERVVLGATDAWVRQPLPAGVGWFPRTAYPRCSFVGAVPGLLDPDTVLPEETLGLVPRGQLALARQFKLPSFDVRFNNGASPGLVFPYLQGGEAVRIAGVSADGELRFALPRERPRLMLDIGMGERELTPVLHTVCVRADERQVDLVWRGAHPYPGTEWLPEMTRLVAEVQ
jgi:hypothetical protein